MFYFVLIEILKAYWIIIKMQFYLVYFCILNTSQDLRLLVCSTTCSADELVEILKFIYVHINNLHKHGHTNPVFSKYRQFSLKISLCKHNYFVSKTQDLHAKAKLQHNSKFRAIINKYKYIKKNSHGYRNGNVRNAFEWNELKGWKIFSARSQKPKQRSSIKNHEFSITIINRIVNEVIKRFKKIFKHKIAVGPPVSKVLFCGWPSLFLFNISYSNNKILFFSLAFIYLDMEKILFCRKGTAKLRKRKEISYVIELSHY